jgi:hypothetical protein
VLDADKIYQKLSITIGADEIGVKRGKWDKRPRGWEGVVLEHGFIKSWSSMDQ